MIKVGTGNVSVDIALGMSIDVFLLTVCDDFQTINCETKLLQPTSRRYLGTIYMTIISRVDSSWSLDP